MIDYNNIPHSIRIVSFRPSWMPQTNEQERPAAKTCPIKYPAYDGTQPECFHDCALYDSRNNRCALEVSAEAQQQTASALARIATAMENPPSVEVNAASMAAAMSRKNHATA